MIDQKHTDSLSLNSSVEGSARQARVPYGLHLEPFIQNDALLDRVLAFAFDTLGVQTLKPYIRTARYSKPYQQI